MKDLTYGFLRYKLLEFRISTIDERIDRLQKLNIFFQIRFDMERSDKIKNKIEFLSRRKQELIAVFQYGN